MKKYFRFLIMVTVLTLFIPAVQIYAQNDLFKAEHYISGSDTLNYRILFPKDFDASQTYPVVLFLHGAGERGNDNQKQLAHNRSLFIENRDAFPAIVILPQCPETDYWSNVNVDRSTHPLTLTFPKNQPPTKALSMVMRLMESMLNKIYVDKNRVYVGGLSMGGMGTFELLSRQPDVFAGAFAICGAGNPDTVPNFAQRVPMWIFHGAKDDVVNPQESLKMVSGILKEGGHPNFSLYANDNHNSWDTAFAEPQLLPWLFSNSKLNSK